MPIETIITFTSPLTVSRDGITTPNEENLSQTYPILISPGCLQNRINYLGQEISTDFLKNGITQITCIILMKGGLFFAADLCRTIDTTITQHIETIAFSSYTYNEKHALPTIIQDIRTPQLHKRHILLIDDILDTGDTLRSAQSHIHNLGASTIHTAICLAKEGAPTDIPVEYIGFHIPPVWAVGYGMDNSETLRNLPYVSYL